MPEYDHTVKVSVEKWTKEQQNTLTPDQKDFLEATFANMVALYPELAQVDDKRSLYELTKNKESEVWIVYMNVLKTFNTESSNTAEDIFDGHLLSFGAPQGNNPSRPLSPIADPLATPKPTKISSSTVNPASSSTSSIYSGVIETFNDFNFDLQVVVPPSPVSKPIEILPIVEFDLSDMEYDEELHDRVVDALVIYDLVEKHPVGLGFKLPSSIYIPELEELEWDADSDLIKPIRNTEVGSYDIGILLSVEDNLNAHLCYSFDIFVEKEDILYTHTKEATAQLLEKLEESAGSIDRLPEQFQVSLSSTISDLYEDIANVLMDMRFRQIAITNIDYNDFKENVGIFALGKDQWKQIRSERPVAPTIRIPSTTKSKYNGKGKQRARGPESSTSGTNFLDPLGLGLILN